MGTPSALFIKAAIPGSTVPETGMTYTLRVDAWAGRSLGSKTNNRKKLRMAKRIRACPDRKFIFCLVFGFKLVSAIEAVHGFIGSGVQGSPIRAIESGANFFPEFD